MHIQRHLSEAANTRGSWFQQSLLAVRLCLHDNATHTLLYTYVDLFLGICIFMVQGPPVRGCQCAWQPRPAATAALFGRM
jgi:hypothetical protein